MLPEKPRCVKCDKIVATIWDIGKDYIEDGEYIVICDNCYIGDMISKL